MLTDSSWNARKGHAGQPDVLLVEAVDDKEAPQADGGEREGGSASVVVDGGRDRVGRERADERADLGAAVR